MTKTSEDNSSEIKSMFKETTGKMQIGQDPYLKWMK